jgi:hypothetical protein
VDGWMHGCVDGFDVAEVDGWGYFLFRLFLYKNCEVAEMVINPLDILAKFGYK